MNNNLTPFDYKKTIKAGLVYLLIAVPFMLVVATALTIIEAPYWLIMLATIVTGGIVIFVSYVIHNKIKDKRKQDNKNDTKFDPFRD